MFGSVLASIQGVLHKFSSHFANIILATVAAVHASVRSMQSILYERLGIISNIWYYVWTVRGECWWRQ